MTKIQVRRGSAVAWSAANPVLAAGEPGFDETAKRMKVGDGATAWNALPYQGIGGRDTASHTTASLAAAAAEDFTLALSKSFALFKVETDVQARVRLYASAAYRTADAARAIGLYCDLVARAALDGMSAQMGAAGIDVEIDLPAFLMADLPVESPPLMAAE